MDGMNQFRWADPPSQTAFPIARAGWPFIIGAAFVTAVFSLLGLVIPALIGLVGTLCICLFFRDPDRATPTDPGSIISPADGKVIRIQQMAESPFEKGPCLKISIFMTVFNVHVNRIPFGGKVENIQYAPGTFFAANKDKAAMNNEHNALFIQTQDGWRYCVVQIAGWVARRIICGVQPGDMVEKGSRFGMICFGSRLDLYLPPEVQPKVRIGEKVLAGATVIGHMG